MEGRPEARTRARSGNPSWTCTGKRPTQQRCYASVPARGCWSRASRRWKPSKCWRTPPANSRKFRRSSSSFSPASGRPAAPPCKIATSRLHPIGTTSRLSSHRSLRSSQEWQGHVRAQARSGPLPPELCPWPRQQAQFPSAGRRSVGLWLAAGDSAVRSFQRVAGILCNEGRGFLTSYRLQLPSERLLHGEWMITPPKAQPPWYPYLERCCTVESFAMVPG